MSKLASLQPKGVSMSANWSVDVERLQSAMAQAVREHWVLFLIEGIVLVILGALAVVIPPVATLAFTVFLGWLFVISGVFGLVTTFGARHAPGFWWSLLSAVLALAAALIIAGFPSSAAWAIGLLVGINMIFGGTSLIIVALSARSSIQAEANTATGAAYPR